MPTIIYSDENIFLTRDNPIQGPGFGQGKVNYDPFYDTTKIVFGDNSPFVSVEELFKDRPGTPFRTDLHRDHVRKFRVMVKTKFIGAAFVCRCPGLPVPFAPYIPYRKEEWDPNALAVKIEAVPENTDDFQAWIVTVAYSTEMPPWGTMFGKQQLGWDDVNGVQNAPWKITPHLEWDTESFTDYPIFDLEGKSYTNAAGQPFTPPAGIQGGYKVVTITRYEKDFETRDEDYVFVCNSTSFKGSPQGYALCTGPRATEMFIGPIKYHRVVYRVLLKKKNPISPTGEFTPGFNPVKILNAGMFERANLFNPLGEGPAPVNALIPIAQFGHAVTNPVLLDADGRVQTIKVPGTDILKPTFIERKGFREVDLNVLTTPQS